MCEINVIVSLETRIVNVDPLACANEFLCDFRVAFVDFLHTILYKCIGVE